MKMKELLILLIALNLIILCYYFLSFPPSNNNGKREAAAFLPKKPPKAQTSKLSLNGKPWPDLPSYLPWHPNPKLAARSCEGYFGNGFTRPFRLLQGEDSRNRELKNGNLAEEAKGGSLSCAYSETLETSICEARKLVMHPERIQMSKGGEDIGSVIGRNEEAELPSYSPGAFEIESPHEAIGDGRVVNPEMLDNIMPQGVVHTHTMRSLLLQLRLVPSAESICSQWIEEPTLIVTRFEYANLFHTFTDWYSAYVTSRVAGLPRRPRLIFVDGHCKSPMEEAWEALFTSVVYAKNFSGPVCFRHALLTPLGYETALFKGLTESIPCYGCSANELKQKPDDRRTARLVEFGEMFRAAFGLLSADSRISRQTSSLSVLFVRREDYLAHPRHKGKVESRLSNEEEVLHALQKWAANHSRCNVNIVNGLFAHMSMIDQVGAVQAASVIVGAHGAGLTHIIAARPGTVILELISSFYRRPHFSLISQWTGLKYQAINLEGSVAKCPEVVEALSGILEGLGC